MYCMFKILIGKNGQKMTSYFLVLPSDSYNKQLFSSRDLGMSVTSHILLVSLTPQTLDLAPYRPVTCTSICHCTHVVYKFWQIRCKTLTQTDVKVGATRCQVAARTIRETQLVIVCSFGGPTAEKAYQNAVEQIVHKMWSFTIIIQNNTSQPETVLNRQMANRQTNMMIKMTVK